MRFSTFLLVFLLGSLALAACSPAAGNADSAAVADQPEAAGQQENAAAGHLMMIVAPEKVPCGEDGTQECLQVKFDPAEDWQTLATPIEGFDYQPGYRYTLLVEKLNTQDPPAEGASAQFMLVAVQDQTEEMVVSVNDLAGVYWVLVGMGDVNAPSGVLEKVQVSLEYDPAESRVFGSGGCNRYFGSVDVNADQFVFSTAPIGAGRMACGEQVMSQEAKFLSILGQVNNFAIKDNLLYLFTGNDEVLLFTPGAAGGR